MAITYHDNQAITENALKGASGITVRTYHYLRDAMALARHHGRRWIEPRHATIAQALGCHKRSVKRAYAWLKLHGLITTQERFKIAPITRNGRSWSCRKVSSRVFVYRTAATALTRRIAVRLATEAAKFLPSYSGDNMSPTPHQTEIDGSSKSFRQLTLPSLFSDQNHWSRIDMTRKRIPIPKTNLT